MQMPIIIKISNNNLTKDAIKQVSYVLKRGGIIAFPTDTVYGIGAVPSNKKAVNKLFYIKKRPSQKPIPILISSKSVLRKVVSKIPRIAGKLINKYWPGALTIVLPKSRSIKSFVTKGSRNVAVRMPNNKIALCIIKAAGGVMAVTSANISGKKEANSAKELQALGGIDLIIDGGRTRIGKASTIVDVTNDIIKVLRAGSIKIRNIM